MPSLRTLALAMIPALLVGGLSAPTVAAPHAAAKSDVSVTLRVFSGGEAADGKITSDRKSCVKQRSVVALGQLNSTGEIVGGSSYVSDDQGHWSTEGMEARGASAASIFVVVPGSAKCDIAQSQRRPVDLRAGGPANVKVSFKLGEASLSGKVTSPDKSCVKRVPVAFLTRFAPDPWQYSEISTRTDKNGKYELTESEARVARIGTGSAIAVVPAQRGCDVAQSPAQALGF